MKITRFDIGFLVGAIIMAAIMYFELLFWYGVIVSAVFYGIGSFVTNRLLDE